MTLDSVGHGSRGKAKRPWRQKDRNRTGTYLLLTGLPVLLCTCHGSEDYIHGFQAVHPDLSGLDVALVEFLYLPERRIHCVIGKIVQVKKSGGLRRI